MNYVVSTQALRDIDAALVSGDSKEVARAREWIEQIRANLAVVPVNAISPLTISNLWAQEAPSIQNFAQTLLLKIAAKP